MKQKNDHSQVMDEKHRTDPILRDVGPYCSNPFFIRDELRIARSKGDMIEYIERRIDEEEGSRKGDLRILLNRMTKKIDKKVTA